MSESELLVKNKQVVVPGQILATGLDYLPGQGAYRYNENIVANKVGLVSIKGRAIKLINLAGVYIPKPDDVILGKVIDVTMFGWRIHTNTAYSSMLSTKDVNVGFIPYGVDPTSALKLGDWVVVSIVKVTSQFLIDVSMYGQGLRKLPSGHIIKVNAMKVPRIIGKQGSMISMIKEHTGCQIVVGQNGVVWLRGLPEAEVVAIKTIQMICDLAHTSGLTERVKAYLEEHCKNLDFSSYKPEDEEQVSGGNDYHQDSGTSGDGGQRQSYDRPRFGGGGFRGNSGGERRDFGNRSGGGMRRSFNRGGDRGGNRGGDRSYNNNNNSNGGNNGGNGGRFDPARYSNNDSGAQNNDSGNQQ